MLFRGPGGSWKGTVPGILRYVLKRPSGMRCVGDGGLVF